MTTKIYVFFVLLGLSAVIIVLSVGAVVSYDHFKDTRVAFLDVGQGDAILISEGSYQILIDGGPDGRTLLEELGKYMPFWDRTIDVVIATHPDSDHIDGLVAVLDVYDVAVYWHADAQKETAVAQALTERVHASQAKIHAPRAGDKIRFNSGVLFEVIHPFAEQVAHPSDDINDASIAATLTVGREVFFLGGDLSQSIEDILPVHEEVTVLKAGHHGSDTSTSKLFLERTAPRDVIVSAGSGNRYGHPHDAVLGRIFRIGARVFRTDRDGTIVYVCTQGADYCELLLH